MLAGQIDQADAFDMQVLTLGVVGVGNKGRAGQGSRSVHGGQRGVSAESGWAGECQGLRVWGSVARWAASAPEGNTKGPFWPQPVNKTAMAARVAGMHKIFRTLNMP